MAIRFAPEEQGPLHFARNVFPCLQFGPRPGWLWFHPREPAVTQLMAAEFLAIYTGETEVRIWPVLFSSNPWQKEGREVPCMLTFRDYILATRY